METKFIKIRFNLHCVWKGFSPEYRIFVNDELFIERTYRVEEPYYYKEMLQVLGPPGLYKIELKAVPPYTNNFIMSDTYIEFGNGKIHNTTEFEIL